VKDGSRKLGYRRTCKTCHSSSAKELNLFKRVGKTVDVELELD
jgi:hypothetical protein